MNINKIFLIIIALVLCNPLIAQENSAGKRIYNTSRINGEAPRIDGLIDNEIWDVVEWSGDFTQREPSDGIAPSQETAFKILYDDDFLYILIRAYDTEPEKIVKRMSRRDGFDGDWVQVNIDSYFDKRTAFAFTASVSGVKGDAIISSDGDRWDLTWDPIWYTKTSIDEEGWIAEMKIPFTQLRFSNHKESQVWGFQVNRRYFRNEERSHWAYFSKDKSGWVRHFGELHGIKNIKPKRQVEVSPYLVVKQENFDTDPDNPYMDKGVSRNLGIGLDGKIGITNDFTLDFTINPDFGQVEADPSEVNLTAFETYFQEKRPFFIEGREITSYQLSGGGNSFSLDNLFYSRRIGRSPQYYPDLNDNEYENRPNNTTILGALKLTGKTKDGLSVGIIESLAAEERSEIYNADTDETRNVTVEPMTNYFVARVQKDLNDNNTIIGGMLTSTNRFIKDDHLNYLNSDAYTGGVDLTQYFKDKKYYLTLKYAMSHIQGDTTAMISQQESSRRYFQRPDNNYTTFDSLRTSMTGHAGTIQAGKQGSSKLRWMTWITYRSPQFETNEGGFLHHSDAIFQVFWAGYRFTEPFSIFRTMSINFDQWSGWDFGLNNSFYGTNLNVFMEFTNHWSLGGGTNLSGENTSNTLLRGGPSIKTPGNFTYWMHLGTDGRKKLQINGNTGNSSGFENSGNTKWYGIDIVYRPFDALRISLMPDYSVSKRELQYVTTEEYNNEDRYVFAKIDQITTDLTIRIDYTITPELTIQYYGSPFITAVDYSDPKYITNPNADNFEDRYSTDMSFTSEDYVNDYDFNFRQFRSNLVARWEYRPGSLIYLVWTQSKTGDVATGDFSFVNDIDALFNIHPYNVFLVKLSFRIAN
ncbi:MAG: carbohydrate binding family 9 domain-containing protein [Bacteroidales bacterium]|nr:carbohydrate binding family 9 domain-containing protein [Bacteroidales bacterium]